MCDGKGILKKSYSFTLLNLRLTDAPTSPTNPIPSSSIVEGSGTVAGKGSLNIVTLLLVPDSLVACKKPVVFSEKVRSNELLQFDSSALVRPSCIVVSSRPGAVMTTSSPETVDMATSTNGCQLY